MLESYVLPSPSPSSPTVPAASPGIHRSPHEPAPGTNPLEITSPGVNVTLDDGTQVKLFSKAFEDATVGISEATSECTYTHLLIYDGGWGGVDMVVKLTKHGYEAIVHLKGASALFPMAELEENLRGMPGGSHLEITAVHEVDKHNHMRQHELNIESKWHTTDAFFRLIIIYTC